MKLDIMDKQMICNQRKYNELQQEYDFAIKMNIPLIKYNNKEYLISYVRELLASKEK